MFRNTQLEGELVGEAAGGRGDGEVDPTEREALDDRRDRLGKVAGGGEAVRVDEVVELVGHRARADRGWGGEHDGGSGEQAREETAEGWRGQPTPTSVGSPLPALASSEREAQPDADSPRRKREGPHASGLENHLESHCRDRVGTEAIAVERHDDVGEADERVTPQVHPTPDRQIEEVRPLVLDAE